MQIISQKSFLLFVSVVMLGLLSLDVAGSSAATSSAAVGASSTTIYIGDKINITVSNTDAQNLSNDIPVSFVGMKEGVAKVTACRQAANCASINITVTKKAAPKKIVKATPKKVVKIARKKVAGVKIFAPVKKPVMKPVTDSVFTPIKLTDLGIQTSSLVLSRTDLNMRVNEITEVIVQDSGAVSVMADSPIVSASLFTNPTLHNVKLTFYGLTPGNGNVKICNQSLICSIVKVNVTAAAPVATYVTPATTPTTPAATTPSAPVTTASASGGYWVTEKFLTIAPGETYWLRTVNAPNLTAASNMWMVPVRVKDNYVVISVSPYYYGEAALKVCNGAQASANCDQVYVNTPSKSGYRSAN